jgi:hypothetical protein
MVFVPLFDIFNSYLAANDVNKILYCDIGISFKVIINIIKNYLLISLLYIKFGSEVGLNQRNVIFVKAEIQENKF